MEERYEIIMMKKYARVYDKLMEQWHVIDYNFYGIENKKDVVEVMKKYYD